MPKKGTNKKKYNYPSNAKIKKVAQYLNNSIHPIQNINRAPKAGPITRISVEQYLKEKEGRRGKKTNR